MPGQILIQRRVRRCNSQITKLGLCLRPRKIECAPSAVGIVIQIGELDCALLLLGDESGKRNMRLGARRNANAHP